MSEVSSKFYYSYRLADCCKISMNNKSDPGNISPLSGKSGTQAHFTPIAFSVKHIAARFDLLSAIIKTDQRGFTL